MKAAKLREEHSMNESNTDPNAFIAQLIENAKATGRISVSLDHVWRGHNLEQVEQRAQAGDTRAAMAMQAIGQALQSLDEPGGAPCSNCKSRMGREEDVVAISVAHFHGDAPMALAIPFCAQCATSEMRVSELAKLALADLGIGEPPRPAKTEDPHEASKAADRDLDAMIRDLQNLRAQRNLPGPVVLRRFDNGRFDDSAWWPERDAQGIAFAIGLRGELGKAEARNAAKAWREVTNRYPKGVFILNIPGYDDDPRELWEFPDVCRFVRWWARFAGMDDPETADRWIGTGKGRLTPPLSHEANPHATAGAWFLAAAACSAMRRGKTRYATSSQPCRVDGHAPARAHTTWRLTVRRRAKGDADRAGRRQVFYRPMARDFRVARLRRVRRWQARGASRLRRADHHVGRREGGSSGGVNHSQAQR
jgi:hypothetical protein